MSGEIRTQGTETWVLDETVSPPQLLKIGNVTSYGDFGPQADDIILTNLESTRVEKLAGLPDDGDATLNINLADTEAHRWFGDNIAGDRFYFYFGYGDGTSEPTIAGGGLVAATDRTGDIVYASVKSFRKQVGTNDVLRVTVALAISGNDATPGVQNFYKSGL
jgi:hypothetical protein